MKKIEENLSYCIQEIADSCSTANRNKSDVRLIAVSKKHGIEKIKEAIKAGQKTFGENKVQEAQKKWSDIKKDKTDIKLHLIGNLQTNKVKEALEIFDVIEVIDRKKLVNKIANNLDKNHQNIEFFVQVNIGCEPQKSGVLPENCNDLIHYATSMGLNIVGLMCIPPKNKNPEKYFQKLQEIANKNDLKFLSMGMSADFKQAILCGSTHIRVGTAIFGQREE